jgi:hypothetical protein
LIREGAVRERLAQLLDGQFDLAEFEDWLVQASWNMHRDSDPSAQDLVSSIELALAEYSSGHVSSAELRSALASLLDKVFVTLRITAAGAAPAKRPSFRANFYRTPVHSELALA